MSDPAQFRLAFDAKGYWSQPVPYTCESLAARTLHFTPGDIQSRMQLQAPEVLDLEYTRMMMGFLLFKPVPSTIAMVGLGGGSIAKFCFKHLPDTRFRAIESNPHVIDLREKFMIPADGPRFSVFHEDGAAFLRHPPKQYDVLLIDGYTDQGLPSQLCSQRFYDHCHAALLPGGILVANLNDDAHNFSAYLKRIARSFQGNGFAVQEQDGFNCIAFARKGVALQEVVSPAEIAFPDLDTTARAEMTHAMQRVSAAARLAAERAKQQKMTISPARLGDSAGTES
ncbi:transferase [Caenimonas sedimenti]|uniref:Transferase n=1 Tax=Caenimonas sedimenti TaxID=2596921 RepID=A0A562ZEG2_9BURK|nr:fused MFS/spermidine synthase [Caenimonas sedimenti]TWO64924.1 transferase [Caenimonas sedimenti]